MMQHSPGNAPVVLALACKAAAELDAGRATAYDDHVEQPLDFVWGLPGERGGLHAVHETTLHLLGILELLHEARMLAHAGDVEGLHLCADGEHKVVVGYRCVGDLALDL